MGDATRVLYVMYGMPSCYNNGFAFARRFQEDGIPITVVCDQDVSVLAAAAGVPFRHLKSLSYSKTTARFHKITKFKNIGYFKKIFSAVRMVRECRQLRRNTLEDNEYLQLVTELNPDVLFIDIECHLAIIASSTLTMPTGICTRLFNHRPGDGVAPLNSNLLPSKQFSKQIRIAMQWWKLRAHSKLISIRQSVSKQRIKPVHYRSFTMPDIKSIARQYQVNLKSITNTNHWFRPLTYTHAPIISMTLRDLDFDRTPDKEFKYLGPMIAEHDFAFDLQADNVSEIDQFIDQSKQNGQAIVYCAMGTYARSEPRFVGLLKEMALLRKDYAYIVSLGGRESVDLYQPFPSNTMLLDAAPQIKCLSHCNAAILHGGIASLQEALKFRVPVLCFSVGTNDQNGTVARWVHHQLATRFSPGNASADSLCSELDRMLADTELANRLKRYSQLIDKSVTDFSPKEIIRELCV